MKRILVTGATGVVGSALVRQLTTDPQVNSIVATYRPGGTPPFAAPPNVHWVPADILDPGALRELVHDMHEVYHAAALVSYQPRQREQLMRVNAAGTALLVDACLDAQVGKLLHVSSVAAIGKTKDKSPINETTYWSTDTAASAYAISKFKAECEVWRGIEEGLCAVIINPSVILGVGNWERSSLRLVQRIARGQRYYPAGATGFVDLRDVVEAAILLMRSDIHSERFILNGANWSYRQLFEALANGLQVPPPSQSIATWQVAIAWRWEKLKAMLWGGPPLLTRETARNAMATTRYDASKIYESLGFKFRPIEDTIAHITAAWRQRQPL